MLSKKAQYAFRALAVMVEKSSAQFREHAGGELPSETRPISIRDIVETQPMSVKFLESIFLELRRAGVLDSKKGKGGGYFLRRHPEDIPLAQVIRWLNTPALAAHHTSARPRTRPNGASGWTSRPRCLKRFTPVLARPL